VSEHLDAMLGREVSGWWSRRVKVVSAKSVPARSAPWRGRGKRRVPGAFTSSSTLSNCLDIAEMALRAAEWHKLPTSLTELCINTTLRCGQSFRYAPRDRFTARLTYYQMAQVG
jgi:hypothetical protein